MYRMENEFITLEMDENGILQELRNRKTGRNLLRPHQLLRLILGDSGCLELDAVPAGRPEVQCEAGRVSLKYSAVECEERGTIPIAVSLSAELCGDEIHWGIALENRSQEQVVREVHYPILSIRDPEPPMAAITSERVSERLENLPAQIRSCFTHYMAPDQKYIRRTALYPGRAASMNCFALDWGNEGLYYGCHDSTFELTGQVFELERQKSVNMYVVRYPFLKVDGNWRECNIVTAPYSGSWTVCAEKYRKWAEGWFTPPQIPDHVAHSSGWQRIILHHQ